MYCYLYFANWNPRDPLPDVIQKATAAFESGKMVMVVFGISSQYASVLPELKLRSELPIDWIVLGEQDREATRAIIESRVQRFAKNDKVTVLKWDENWLGFSYEDVKPF